MSTSTLGNGIVLADAEDFVDLFQKGLSYPSRPLMMSTKFPCEVLSKSPNPGSFHLMIADGPSSVMELSIDKACRKVAEAVEVYGVNPVKVDILQEHMPLAYIHVDFETKSKTSRRAEFNAFSETNEGLVHVSFVDTAEEGWVKCTELYPPSIDMIRIPRLAIHCRLSQIVPTSGVNTPWSSQTEIDYTPYFQGGNFIATAASIDRGITDVYLEVDGRNVGVQLVDEGMAMFTPLKPEFDQLGQHLGKYPVNNFSDWIGLKVPVFALKQINDQEAAIQLFPEQANETFDLIAEYAKKIKEQGGSMEEKFSKQVGDPVLVIQSDEFIRATITKKLPNGYQVKYVDYLDFEIVTEDKMMKIPDELVRLPEGATLCIIADLVSIPSEQKKGLERIFNFENMYGCLAATGFVSDEKTSPKIILTVEISVDDGKSYKPLHEFLNSPAVPLNKYYCQNFPPLSTSVASRLFNGTSDYFPGKKYQTFFTYCDNEKSIYLHVELDDTRANELAKEMTDFYENWTDCPKLTAAEAAVGVFLVAQPVEGDNNWYRAKVTDVNPSENLYEVIFLDYGNQEFVGLEKLKPLISYFGMEKCFALQVALPVEIIPDVKTPDEITDIIYKFCDSDLDVFLESCNSSNYAWIMSNRESLAHKMVDMGVAKLAMEPNCDIFN